MRAAVEDKHGSPGFGSFTQVWTYNRTPYISFRSYSRETEVQETRLRAHKMPSGEPATVIPVSSMDHQHHGNQISPCHVPVAVRVIPRPAPLVRFKAHLTSTRFWLRTTFVVYLPTIEQLGPRENCRPLAYRKLLVRFLQCDSLKWAAFTRILSAYDRSTTE